MRYTIGFLVLVLVVPVFGIIAFGQAKKKAITYGNADPLLVTGAFPKRWKYVSSDKNSKLAGTWVLDDKTDKKNPVLICTGMPSGYVRTIDKYSNFDLHVEWFYPKENPNCNSGILIHCGEDKVWPASVQVQLHRPLAGSIFPLKGATTTNKVQVKALQLSVGVWHTCRILSQDGTITLWINKKKIGAVTGCKPASGYIGLQSEGSEIRFRRFEIRKPVAKKKPAKRVKPKKKVPSPKTEPKRSVLRLFPPVPSSRFVCRPTNPKPQFIRWRTCVKSKDRKKDRDDDDDDDRKKNCIRKRFVWIPNQAECDQCKDRRSPVRIYTSGRTIYVIRSKSR